MDVARQDELLDEVRRLVDATDYVGRKLHSIHSLLLFGLVLPPWIIGAIVLLINLR